MIFSAKLHSKICNLCLEKRFLRYQCETCDYLMCNSCYQKYLSFKYESCPQCRQSFKVDHNRTRSRMDDIVPTISNGTLRIYFIMYLLSLFGLFIYWFFDWDILNIKIISYLSFFLFMGMCLFFIPIQIN